MKSGYIAFLLFLTLTVGVFANAFFIHRALFVCKNEVKAFTKAGQNEPSLAVQDCELAFEKWKKREKYLSFFIHRKEIAAVDLLYRQTLAAAKENMAVDFLTFSEGLCAGLEQLDNMSSLRLRYLF